MRKQAQAVPAAQPGARSLRDAAQRVLRLTARAWLPAALLRARHDPLRPDERVRLHGEW
ncbi:MAG: hypothetical protein Q4G70_05855 [Pseudomonadota bacterium]|nr:hypothetical protein [Pseudomonadota bacterium]